MDTAISELPGCTGVDSTLGAADMVHRFEPFVIYPADKPAAYVERLGKWSARNGEPPVFIALTLSRLGWKASDAEEWIRNFFTVYDDYVTEGKIPASRPPLLLVETDGLSDADMARLQTIGSVVLEKQGRWPGRPTTISEYLALVRSYHHKTQQESRASRSPDG
ncbi:hypothetical protein [Fimbriiglobus ruber]|uniref:Uncharacterized protein n=1 Tax=Fimbriiglobus ruber TaxID=1908690 RepID=A0A225DAN7_9BACT|nr:hypothetical protein [Fimbriiglobus ruber]OWK38621.1 hypothetical protein FRUB_07741 [Fimbriiglobus ruber]